MNPPITEAALKVVDWLRGGCARIEIAGSLRRGKATPTDIEIVCIPAFRFFKQPDLFGGESINGSVSMLDVNFPQLLASENGEAWEYDAKLKRNGEAYKRLRHKHLLNHRGDPVALDLFITTPDQWGVIFAFRTGPAEFSHALNLRAERLGYHITGGRLHLHAKSGGLFCAYGDSCPWLASTPEEADLFSHLRLPYLAPAQRRPEDIVLTRVI